MKKLLFILICFMSFINTCYCDGIDIPVTFTLLENFFSKITQTYEDNTIVFNYNNTLLNMDLTDTQLKKILSQKSGSGSARLAYYETLNIKVKPVVGTPFESLKDKMTFYRANGSGSWVSSLTHNQNLEETAVINNLDNNFWPWGFRIVYRTDPTGTFTASVPNKVNLENKSLEEQLATVLNMNLTTEPNSVIDSYNTLWKLSLLNNYTFLLRFDFLDEKKETLPQLKAGSTTEYLTSSLNNLGTYYVAIKYSREEEREVSLTIDKEDKKKWIIPTATISTLLFGTIIFLIKNKMKIFNNT